jgi:hypothetical protein
MIDQALAINWSAVGLIAVYVVAAYIVLCGIVGFVKGWGAVLTILHWTGKLWWLFVVIIGLILVASTMKGKKKQKEEISAKIDELNHIDNKTAEDNRKLAELQNQRKEIEKEIVNTAKKYEEKVNKLKDKPKPDVNDPSKDPPPGDAAGSSDALNKTW